VDRLRVAGLDAQHDCNQADNGKDDEGNPAFHA